MAIQTFLSSWSAWCHKYSISLYTVHWFPTLCNHCLPHIHASFKQQDKLLHLSLSQFPSSKTSCVFLCEDKPFVVRRQQSFTRHLFMAYLQGDLLPLADGQHKLPTDVRFLPFEASYTIVCLCKMVVILLQEAASVYQRATISLFASAIVALRSEVSYLLSPNVIIMFNHRFL
jgi:hypothetical protein